MLIPGPPTNVALTLRIIVAASATSVITRYKAIKERVGKKLGGLLHRSKRAEQRHHKRSLDLGCDAHGDSDYILQKAEVDSLPRCRCYGKTERRPDSLPRCLRRQTMRGKPIRAWKAVSKERAPLRFSSSLSTPSALITNSSPLV